jgi:hypothetical protein
VLTLNDIEHLRLLVREKMEENCLTSGPPILEVVLGESEP